SAERARPGGGEGAAPGPATPTTWFGLFGLIAIAGSLPVAPGGVIVTTWAPGARGRRVWTFTVGLRIATNPSVIESRAMRLVIISLSSSFLLAGRRTPGVLRQCSQSTRRAGNQFFLSLNKRARSIDRRPLAGDRAELRCDRVPTSMEATISCVSDLFH